MDQASRDPVSPKKARTEEETIQALAEIDSVKNDELDAEHEECSSALELLSQHRSASALANFLDIFQRHCDHEESLLEEHLYAPEEKRVSVEGGVSLLLNSRTSHFQDHKKLIGSIKQELDRLGGDTSDALVSVSFVNGLLRGFENHANVYDASYADRLAVAVGA